MTSSGSSLCIPKAEMRGVVESLVGKNSVKIAIFSYQKSVVGKIINRKSCIICHYRDIDLQLNDEVMFVQCRPMSKTKAHLVVRKVSV